MYAAISQGESGLRLGLVPGGSLITSLKQRVVALASNNGVLSTVQTAAQAVLQNGWSLLLPTAEERARALSALLPTAGITRIDARKPVTSDLHCFTMTCRIQPCYFVPNCNFCMCFYSAALLSLHSEVTCYVNRKLDGDHK